MGETELRHKGLAKWWITSTAQSERWSKKHENKGRKGAMIKKSMRIKEERGLYGEKIKSSLSQSSSILWFKCFTHSPVINKIHNYDFIRNWLVVSQINNNNAINISHLSNHKSVLVHFYHFTSTAYIFCSRLSRLVLAYLQFHNFI